MKRRQYIAARGFVKSFLWYTTSGFRRAWLQRRKELLPTRQVHASTTLEAAGAAVVPLTPLIRLHSTLRLRDHDRGGVRREESRMMGEDDIKQGCAAWRECQARGTIVQEERKQTRDARVTELKKSYLVDDRILFFSATTMASWFSYPFDAHHAAKSMMSSSTWPQVGYAIDAVVVAHHDAWRSDQTTQVVVDGRCKAILPRGTSYAAARESHPDAELVQFSRAMTVDEVVKKWDDNSRAARIEGTRVHDTIERHIRGDTTSSVTPPDDAGVESADSVSPDEFARRYVEAFLMDNVYSIGGVVIGTEWTVYDEDCSVVASIDLAVRFLDGSVGIVEWKHARRLSSKTMSTERMREPFDHLHDCDLVKYTIQLGIYAQILERKYAACVSTLVVVNTHPEDAFFTEVPYLRIECEHIMERARSLFQSRRCHRLPTCVTDGFLAIDPVACEDGNVRSRKEANRLGLKYQNRRILTEAAERAMSEVFEPTPRYSKSLLELKQAASWEETFPIGGMPQVSLHFKNWLPSFF